MLSLKLGKSITHIGSFPFVDINKSLQYTFKFDIPVWPQLPKYKDEGMINQFCELFPGYDPITERIDYNDSNFEYFFMKIEDDYQKIIIKDQIDLLNNYIPSPNRAKTLAPFVEMAKKTEKTIIKGQITGPFTLATALKDSEGQPIIFLADLKELLIKFLTIKSLALAKKLQESGKQVIIFIDEPGLAGFGSSTLITIAKEEIINMLQSIILILKKNNIITGIHVCANTSWDIIFSVNPDIVSFDSFSYFDKFILYKNEIKQYISTNNTYLAWGCVPTNEDKLLNLYNNNLYTILYNQLNKISNLLEIPLENVLEKSIFTPSCGMGSLSEKNVDLVIKHLYEIKKNLYIHNKRGG